VVLIQQLVNLPVYGVSVPRLTGMICKTCKNYRREYEARYNPLLCHQPLSKTFRMHLFLRVCDVICWGWKVQQIPDRLPLVEPLSKWKLEH